MPRMPAEYGSISRICPASSSRSPDNPFARPRRSNSFRAGISRSSVATTILPQTSCGSPYSLQKRTMAAAPSTHRRAFSEPGL